MRHILLSLSLICLLVSSCEDKKNDRKQKPVDLLNYRAAFSIQPISAPIPLGNPVIFVVQQTDSTLAIDSIQFLLDGVIFDRVGKKPNFPIQLTWKSDSSRTGSHIFSLNAFSGTNEPESATLSFFIKSNQVPETYTYQVVKSFPHSTASFTQGLEWVGNRLYEGTGLNGKSSVMEVQLESGKSLIKKDLPYEFFGEGITVMNGKLYQITWQNKRGFVYSLPNLEKIQEFGYSSEGWGLTHWKGLLAMTDGTNRIQFLNPTNFSVSHILEVWDEKNPIDALNELEEIDGFLYANKYMTDTLVKIDPNSGKVLAYIDLTGILPQNQRTGDEDVLNGIAWRKDENLMYVTGKNWPKIFAIRLTKKRGI